MPNVSYTNVSAAFNEIDVLLVMKIFASSGSLQANLLNAFILAVQKKASYMCSPPLLPGSMNSQLCRLGNGA